MKIMKGGYVLFGLLILGVLDMAFSKNLNLDIKINCHNVCFLKKPKIEKQVNIEAPLPKYKDNGFGLTFFFNRFNSLNSMINNIKSLNLSKTYPEPSIDVYEDDIRRNANYHEKSIVIKNTYIRPTNGGNQLVELYQVSPQLDFGLALSKKFK